VARNGGVEILKFNDYQCPACRRTAEEYGSSIARLTTTSNGAVRFKEMDFPLETECNPFARADLHPAACESAVAVRLAREHGTDKRMIDWLWTNQAALTAASVREAAHRVASVNDYDLRYEEVLKRVRDDVTIGNRVGVAGTPTFFVNGRKLTVIRPADFEAAVKYELGWQVQ
jgi:protein-disulfide isomerase